MQGWLGNRDTILHSGEGAISIARWAGKLVAWANDKGIKVRPGDHRKLSLPNSHSIAVSSSKSGLGQF